MVASDPLTEAGPLGFSSPYGVVVKIQVCCCSVRIGTKTNPEGGVKRFRAGRAYRPPGGRRISSAEPTVNVKSKTFCTLSGMRIVNQPPTPSISAICRAARSAASELGRSCRAMSFSIGSVRPAPEPEVVTNLSHVPYSVRDPVLSRVSRQIGAKQWLGALYCTLAFDPSRW